MRMCFSTLGYSQQDCTGVLSLLSTKVSQKKPFVTLGQQNHVCRSHFSCDSVPVHKPRQGSSFNRAERVLFKRSKNKGGNNIQRKIFSLFDVLKEGKLEDVSQLLKQKSESVKIIFFSLTKVLKKEGSNSVYHKAVSTAKRIQ